MYVCMCVCVCVCTTHTVQSKNGSSSLDLRRHICDKVETDRNKIKIKETTTSWIKHWKPVLGV